MTDQSATPREPPRRPSAVNLDRLADDIRPSSTMIPPEPPPSQPPEQFKPPHMRSSFLTNKGSSDLKMIADSLKRLVWDDAEKLGTTVAKNIVGGEKISGSEIAAAIQRAADELRAAESEA
jgi:hypothetical protein